MPIFLTGAIWTAALYASPAVAHYTGPLAAALFLFCAGAPFILAAFLEPDRSVIFAPYYHFAACAVMLGSVLWQAAALLELGGRLPDIFSMFYYLYIFGASPALICGAPLWVWLWRRL